MRYRASGLHVPGVTVGILKSIKQGWCNIKQQPEYSFHSTGSRQATESFRMNRGKAFQYLDTKQHRQIVSSAIHCWAVLKATNQDFRCYCASPIVPPPGRSWRLARSAARSSCALLSAAKRNGDPPSIQLLVVLGHTAAAHKTMRATIIPHHGIPQRLQRSTRQVTRTLAHPQCNPKHVDCLRNDRRMVPAQGCT
jgi:hypothetical protein